MMPVLSLVFGLLLVGLGLGTFIGTGHTHYTALIPAYFGAVLLLCGLVGATAPKLRMHVMHVAALVGLIGAGGGLGMSLPKLFAVEPLARPLAAYSQLALGVLCGIFLALCVRSFVAARRARLPNL